MQLENWLALTLALSPRRGNSLRPRWDESPEGEVIRGTRKLLPLPGGEGRGEGERLIRPDRSGPGRWRMVLRHLANRTRFSNEFGKSAIARKARALSAACATLFPAHEPPIAKRRVGRLPLPARHERGEGRGEGLLTKDNAAQINPPLPSPLLLRRRRGRKARL